MAFAPSSSRSATAARRGLDPVLGEGVGTLGARVDLDHTRA